MSTAADLIERPTVIGDGSAPITTEPCPDWCIFSPHVSDRPHVSEFVAVPAATGDDIDAQLVQYFTGPVAIEVGAGDMDRLPAMTPAYAEILARGILGLAAQAAPPTASGRIEELAGLLAGALDEWAGRDDTRPEPEVRRAANLAHAIIDEMTRALFAARQQLGREMRASDDATDAGAL